MTQDHPLYRIQLSSIIMDEMAWREGTQIIGASSGSATRHTASGWPGRLLIIFNVMQALSKSNERMVLIYGVKFRQDLTLADFLIL
jgi:hypothetical protein